MSGRLFHDARGDLPRAQQKRLRQERPKPQLDFSHWRYPFGFSLTLLGDDGSRRVYDAVNYADAVSQRTDAMRTGRFWCAWIEMKNI